MDGADLDDTDLNVANLNDTELTTAIAAGYAKADSIFISRNFSFVLSICRHNLKNEAEPEEAAQDVFATIWKKADQFSQRDARVTTWLYSVPSNRCIDILHRQKPSQDIDGLEFAHSSDNAEVLQQKSQRARLLRVAMRGL